MQNRCDLNEFHFISLHGFTVCLLLSISCMDNLIIHVFCRSDDNDGTVENSCRMNLEKCIEDAKLSSHSDDLTGFLMPSSTSPTNIGKTRGC